MPWNKTTRREYIGRIEFAVKNVEPVTIAGVFGVMRDLELQEIA